MEVTACNTITNLGAGGRNGRAGEKQVFYLSGESNRRSGWVRTERHWLAAWLTFWAPDSPGQIRKARIISFLPCPALPTSLRRLL